MTFKKQTRREFIATGAAALGALSLGTGIKAETAIFPDAHTELAEITIAELGSKMASGELTSVKLVEMYTARIKELDPEDTLRAGDQSRMRWRSRRSWTKIAKKAVSAR